MMVAPSNAPGMHWPMIRIITFYTRWGGAYAFSRKIHVAISVGWMDDLRVYVLLRSRRNLFNRKRRSIAHSLSLSTSHRPDMTETLLKRT